MKTLLIFSCTTGHRGKGQREELSMLEAALHALALSSPACVCWNRWSIVLESKWCFYIKGPLTRKDSHPHIACRLWLHLHFYELTTISGISGDMTGRSAWDKGLCSVWFHFQKMPKGGKSRNIGSRITVAWSLEDKVVVWSTWVPMAESFLMLDVEHVMTLI